MGRGGVQLKESGDGSGARAASGGRRSPRSVSQPSHGTAARPTSKHAITLIPGDGIGPEIAAATCRVIEASGVAVDWDTQEAGAKAAQTRGATLPDEVLANLESGFEGTDIVIVRENAEDLYTGLELMIMPGVAQGGVLIVTPSGAACSVGAAA